MSATSRFFELRYGTRSSDYKIGYAEIYINSNAGRARRHIDSGCCVRLSAAIRGKLKTSSISGAANSDCV